MGHGSQEAQLKAPPARASARRQRIDAESPLRVPLIARALSDPQIRLVPRAIDNTWVYRQVVSRSNTGFNPFSGCVYYAAHGALAPWLAHPERSGRNYNAQDSMMRELLFVVHDYLHAWSYGLIRDLMPKLDLGRAKITPSNIERFMFAHLLTEAVATVGLDYWCLATERLGDRCPMGTAIEGATTSYREWHRPEYERVWPDLVDVQEPAFLHWLLSSYLTGGARMSISERQMDRSALLARWIRGELTYAQHQRRYIQKWLEHLGGIKRSRAARADNGLLRSEYWQQDLVIEVAHRTWALVKHDKTEPLRDLLDPESCWQTREGSELNFDLTNLNTLSGTELRKAATSQYKQQQQRALCEQYVMQFRYSDIEAERLPRIQRAVEAGSFAKLRPLFRGCEPIPPNPKEPRDLMLYA